MDQVVHLNQKETPPPFSYLLSDKEPGLLVNTVFGSLPLGACLAYQLQDYGRPNTTFLTNYSGGTSPQDSSVPRCLEFPDIPHCDLFCFVLRDIWFVSSTRQACPEGRSTNRTQVLCEVLHPTLSRKTREIGQNTGNYVPYSFRWVCGFFNVPC